jgi:hypothetical protein
MVNIGLIIVGVHFITWLTSVEKYKLGEIIADENTFYFISVGWVFMCFLCVATIAYCYPDPYECFLIVKEALQTQFYLSSLIILFADLRIYTAYILIARGYPLLLMLYRYYPSNHIYWNIRSFFIILFGSSLIRLYISEYIPRPIKIITFEFCIVFDIIHLNYIYLLFSSKRIELFTVNWPVRNIKTFPNSSDFEALFLLISVFLMQGLLNQFLNYCNYNPFSWIIPSMFCSYFYTYSLSSLQNHSFLANLLSFFFSFSILFY